MTKLANIFKNSNVALVIYVVVAAFIGVGILGTGVYAATGRNSSDIKLDFIFMGVALFGLLLISKGGFNKRK